MRLHAGRQVGGVIQGHTTAIQGMHGCTTYETPHRKFAGGGSTVIMQSRLREQRPICRTAGHDHRREQGLDTGLRKRSWENKGKL